MCVGARGLLVFVRYVHVCGCTGVACVREIRTCVCGCMGVACVREIRTCV